MSLSTFQPPNHCTARRLRAVAIRALLLGLTCLTVGCSPWIRQQTSEPLLPTAEMSRDSVVLEIAFVHIGPDDAAAEAAIWRSLDETAIDLSTRHRLDANGIRAGRAGVQLPEELMQLVARTAKETELAPSDDTASGDGQQLRQRRIQVRAGQRAKVVASSTYPEISVLSREEDGRVHGKQFNGAQCLFSVKAFPQSDSLTELEVLPEIEHGEVKNRWVALEGALVQQSGKERTIYDKLKIDLPLMPGQTLVIGSTEQAGGLGQHYFNTTSPSPRRLMLLIRVAQTQQEDIFEPREAVSSATPGS